MYKRKNKLIERYFRETLYLRAGKVLYDQLPLNPARAGRQQR